MKNSCKSLLTFWGEKDTENPDGPQSIIKLLKAANQDKCYFVSTNFHTLNEALKISKKEKIQLIFGLNCCVTQDRFAKSEESRASNSKVIIWGKNSESYTDLIKLYSGYHTDIACKYYEFRADWNYLREKWTKNLLLSLPFYDSFVANNMLVHNSNIVPSFLPDDLVIFREQNSQHPHVNLINEALDKFNHGGKYEDILTKTILYEKREDVKSWMVYRSIHNRATFAKPEMPFCCSDSFCWEDYLDLIK